MADGLFPDLPEDIKALSDDDLGKLLDDHVSAAALIDADDQEFLGEMDADEILAQYKAGVEQIKRLREEQKERAAAFENFQEEKAKIKAELEEQPAEKTAEEAEEAETDEVKAEEPAEQPEPVEETEVVAETVEELVPVTAATTPSAGNVSVRFSRTPPTPSVAREPQPTVEQTGAALVASSQFRGDHPGPLDQDSLANLMRGVASDLGPSHDGKGAFKQRVEPWQIDHYPDGKRVEHGGGYLHWDGPKTKVAGVEFEFPGDRTLTGGDDDFDKIRAALPQTAFLNGKPGTMSQEALTASGGICAPSTPFYSLVNFGTEATPVWDSLPVFAANRGGVNIPDSSYIADITTAISSISEANDALGGTFATKSCQDLTCPSYTETQVNIFAHCREYGNLNARSWPEKIAHENALTMQALARTSEEFMLDRIKALSVNVTNGATTLGLTIYLVEAIVRARFGLIGRFRMPRDTRFRVLMPYWVPDVLQLDNISTQFDRFNSKDELVAYLRTVGIDPVFYLDTPTTGTTQLPDSSQTAAAIDSTPANIQWAIYPEGAFLGIDMGSLELGIVRDSTLNSTNDFQVFGEYFRNLARLAPAQAAYWVTTTYCAQGSFPPAGTARTCP